MMRRKGHRSTTAKVALVLGIPTLVVVVLLMLFVGMAAAQLDNLSGALAISESQPETEMDGNIQAGVVKGKRTSYPSSSNAFYFSSKYNPFVGTSCGPPALTHNCTWYAYGRFAEILGRKPNGLATGNASTWYAATRNFPKGQTPRVGAIICWRYTDDPFGHVAVVEEIKSNGDIVTSNSGWRAGPFWLQTWTKASGYQGGHYRLQGFIYQP